jgi:putative membrane protein
MQSKLNFWLQVYFNIFLSGYLIYLNYTGKLVYYIHPKYIIWVFWAALLVFFVSLIFIVQTNFSDKKTFLTKSNLRNFKQNLGFQIKKITLGQFLNLSLSILLIIACFFPPKPLNLLNSHNIVIANSQNLGFYNTEKNKNTPSKKLKNEIITTLNVQQWSSLIQDDPQLKIYKDQQTKLIGFVTNLDKNSLEVYFDLSRLLISCCAVDASPVSLRAKINLKTLDKENLLLIESLKNDNWLEVKGYFDFVVVRESNRPILVIQEFKKISTPEIPYIYY